MSDYISDIGNYLNSSSPVGAAGRNAKADKSQLDMTDFLTLMVKEMTSQTIDSSMDTSDMLNQLVQMQMVQAMTNMTDASIMSYSASLVGKEVTVGQYDSDGNLQELVGTVTGTGVLGGKQVIFVGDKYYLLSEIMAVGRLPAKPDGGEVKPDGGGEVKPEEGGGAVKPEEGGSEVKPDPSEKPGGDGTATPDQGEKPAEGQNSVG